MSKTFIAFRGQETLSLNMMANATARLFVATAQVAAEFYGIPSSVGTEDHADEYIVQEDEFCNLVESVYEHQLPEFYEWLRHAAATYEAIKGQRLEWHWEHPPAVPFAPIRLDGYAPG